MTKRSRLFLVLFLLTLTVSSLFLGSPPIGFNAPSPALASGPTEVGGLISVDTIWMASNSPYIVTGNTLVNSGVRLTIEPGVTVKFTTGTALQINGKLIAQGTGSNPIVFTSSQLHPAPGNWAYILFSDSSVDATYDVDGNYTGGSILEHAVVEYAGGADISNDGG